MREKDKATRYIILGSGIAGMAAAEAIRQRDPSGSIHMISAERELCFNRPMLISEFALDGSGAVLFDKQQDWPDKVGVKLDLGTVVTAIDREAKTVRLQEIRTESSPALQRGTPIDAVVSAGAPTGADGTKGESITSVEPERVRSMAYDKLIYALGAEATVPPIPGADREHVHVVRTREDMRQIRRSMEGAEFAVVIGGGMLGLEDAWALREQRLDVAVIEQKQRVACGQLDQSAGNLMKKRIERMGVPVYLNASVVEIGDGYVTFTQDETDFAVPDGGAGCAGCCPAAARKIQERVTIPADLVILSAGVTPCSQLGADAGLKLTGQWLAVDEHCRTCDPDIFAAGDCAAVNGRNDAIWDEARQMGRIAGTNAALTQTKVGSEAAPAPKASAVSDVSEDSGVPGAPDDSDVSDIPNTAGTQDASGTSNVPDALNASEELEAYVPVVAEHVFTGFDTEVFTMADSSGAGTDGVYIRHADVEIFDYQRERYIRVSLQDGRMAGVLLINAPELAPELMEAYRAGAGEEEARQIIQRWKDSHEVDFKPAAPFRHR